MGYLKYLLRGLRKIYNEPERKGRRGEKMLRRFLGNKYGYIFDDYIILDSKGYSHQIDTILVNNAGVYIIEVKNFAGSIYGNDNMPYWYQYLNGEKREFYSPVLQNKSHFNLIRELLPHKIAIRPMVVFVNGDISHVQSYSTYNLVQLRETLEKDTEFYKDETVEKVIRLLEDARELDITDKQHAKSVKEYKKDNQLD